MVVEEQEATGQMRLAVPEELPILPTLENTIFPYIVVPVATENKSIIQIIDAAMEEHKMVGAFGQRGEQQGDTVDSFGEIGTAAAVARMFKLPDGSIRVFLQGVSRIRMKEITQTEPYIRAKVEVVESTLEESKELEALTRNFLGLFQRMVELAPNLPSELGAAALNITDPGNLADFVAAHINLKREEAQDVLATLDVAERLRKLSHFINREVEILEIGSRIQAQIKGDLDKAQREYLIREQIKALQKELGETDERAVEIMELRQKVEEAQLPPEALKEVERELDRLEKMPPSAAEYTMSRTYLDWMISLPWSKSTEDKMDINRASEILDEDHYDLEKVKGRILDYLAVLSLRQDMKAPILCFLGPPGTGKTSMGRSIARALGRNFYRMSLGGIRDEAEIRGHRRTYIGALPGRIIQGIRRAESNNPVFMLDEIDKVGMDFRGDPSAALLEVLDPEQNNAFVDNYLGVPFDLSKVIFITTANVIDPIPPALKDRMEIIELSGYTPLEKLHIARRFLIPRQLKENGLSADQLQITDEAMFKMIESYTREAGVRNLEREIGTVCRKIARKVAAGEEVPDSITVETLIDLLGPERLRVEAIAGEDEIGVATGLAWTPTGGDILFIEATPVKGKGNLILTGKLGEVMQESARAAMTYTRSRAAMLGIEDDFPHNRDVHIHVPAGAIPKDGPSAGVPMTIALISALTKRAVKRDVGMTGEITLRGKVLPVGGIRDKVLAAHRSGIKEIILPKANEKDLDEIPEEVKGDLKFATVENIDQAIGVALKSLEESELPGAPTGV